MKKTNQFKFIASIFVLSFLVWLIFNLLNEPFTINLFFNVFVLAIFTTIIATVLTFVILKLFPKK